MKLDKIALEYNQEIVERIMAGKMDYICFGAGNYLSSFVNAYCKNDAGFPLPRFVCDNNSQKWGKMISEIPIEDPDVILNLDFNHTVVVLSAVLPFGILDSLGDYRRCDLRILTLRQIETFFMLQDKGKELNNVYELLNDEKSRWQYEMYFNFLLRGSSLCPMLYSPNAYVNNDIVPQIGGGGYSICGCI